MGCMSAWLCGSQSTPPGRTHLQRLALAQVLAGTSVNLSLGAGMSWATSVTDGERPLHKALQVSMSTDCSISRLLMQLLHWCLVWNNIRKHEASSSYKEHIGIMQDTTDGLSSFSANKRTLLLAITLSGCTSHTLQQDSSPHQGRPVGAYPMHYHVKDSRHFISKLLIFRSLMQKWHSYCHKTHRLSWLPVWSSRKKDCKGLGAPLCRWMWCMGRKIQQ